MTFPRSSGLLLHITSLPSNYGVGDLGPEAYRFVDFLASAAQTWWQVLPVGPLGYGNSPYNSPSAFAGNPLLISPELLIEDGYLLAADIKEGEIHNSDRVNYGEVYAWKRAKLEMAFDRFQKDGSAINKKAFKKFCAEHASWLDSFALFQVLKDLNDHRHWLEWKLTDVQQVEREHAADLSYVRFVQFLFFSQWKKLKKYANQKKVKIIGDVPIFVAMDSVDVWANRDLFFLSPEGRPTLVAGVPPDYFSAEGQLWGNPLYNWQRHQQTNFHWWISRLKQAFSLFDAVRLDHFIGFVRTWAVPIEAASAKEGTWMASPGEELFKKVLSSIKKANFVAEDLGLLTPEVEALRDQLKFPGMRVLQFDFGEPDNLERARPFQQPKNSVIYTGTHDNTTIAGWFAEVKETNADNGELSEAQKEREFALIYCGSDRKEPHWDMIRLAMACPANLAMIPVQDVLGLDASARMNTPGHAAENWEWRLSKNQLTSTIAKRLTKLTKEFDRRKKT